MNLVSSMPPNLAKGEVHVEICLLVRVPGVLIDRPHLFISRIQSGKGLSGTINICEIVSGEAGREVRSKKAAVHSVRQPYV